MAFFLPDCRVYSESTGTTTKYYIFVTGLFLDDDPAKLS